MAGSGGRKHPASALLASAGKALAIAPAGRVGGRLLRRRPPKIKPCLSSILSTLCLLPSRWPTHQCKLGKNARRQLVVLAVGEQDKIGTSQPVEIPKEYVCAAPPTDGHNESATFRTPQTGCSVFQKTSRRVNAVGLPLAPAAGR